MIGISLALSPGNPAITKGGYTPEARAFFSRLPTPVAPARKRAANDLFKTLNDGGLLSKLDLMYLPIGEAGDEDNNLVNWISDTYAASAVNAPTYATFGWTGDGAMQYIETGAPQNALANYSQDDAFLGEIVLSNVADNLQLDCGFSAPTTYICSRSSSDTILVRANASGGSVISFAIPGTPKTSVGFSWFTRQSSSDVYIGRNDTASTVLSQPSSTLGTNTFKMLRSGTGYTTRKLSGLLGGGGFTPSDGEAIGQAIATYYATLGVTF